MKNILWWAGVIAGLAFIVAMELSGAKGPWDYVIDWMS